MEKYENNSKRSGIYQIRNLVNGKVYIGSSFRFANRKSQHFKQLSQNIHPNTKLQNAFNKYGIDNFVFEIIEFCDSSLLVKREQFYLDMIEPFDVTGYNILKEANNSLGFKHSESTKELIASLQKGKKVSQEVKDLLYYYSKGRKVSQETKDKLSQIHKGKVLTEENKILLSEKLGIAIEQFDLEDNFIAAYRSIKHASKSTNVAEQTIIDSIKNKRKPKKYKWKIKN